MLLFRRMFALLVCTRLLLRLMPSFRGPLVVWKDQKRNVSLAHTWFPFWQGEGEDSLPLSILGLLQLEIRFRQGVLRHMVAFSSYTTHKTIMFRI